MHTNIFVLFTVVQNHSFSFTLFTLHFTLLHFVYIRLGSAMRQLYSPAILNANVSLSVCLSVCRCEFKQFCIHTKDKYRTCMSCVDCIVCVWNATVVVAVAAVTVHRLFTCWAVVNVFA